MAEPEHSFFLFGLHPACDSTIRVGRRHHRARTAVPPGCRSSHGTMFAGRWAGATKKAAAPGLKPGSGSLITHKKTFGRLRLRRRLREKRGSGVLLHLPLSDPGQRVFVDPSVQYDQRFNVLLYRTWLTSLSGRQIYRQLLRRFFAEYG